MLHVPAANVNVKFWVNQKQCRKDVVRKAHYNKFATNVQSMCAMPKFMETEGALHRTFAAT